ncbi:MAG: PocR ligand-binding domain-containing protein [Myxococcales bacterium]|nr:PocR ligand-binding domain-containing protein [Myxococcales bacterium]
MSEDAIAGPASEPLAGDVELADIVDLDALRAIARNVNWLFGVPVRVFSKSGALVAEVGAQAAICGLVNGVPDGRKGCSAVVAEVKRQALSAEAPAAIACFTSARYEIVPVEHHGECGGRFVIGPYRLDPDPDLARGALPQSLVAIDARLDATRALRLLPEMVTLSAERAQQLCDHVRLVLENVMRAGYQALVTSRMHLAATRESYRELRAKHAQLEDANRRLQELDSLKTSFLSTVSHELRTPLTSIIGYGDMLLDGMAGPLTDEQRTFLSVVRRQSDQLLHLITTLLDASRLERGTMPIQKQPTKIAEVLADVVSTLAPRAIEKGVYLELRTEAAAPGGPASGKVGDAAPVVFGDPNRLRQVFLNLVENAVKFSPADGSGIVSLSTRVVEDGDADRVGYILFAPLERKVEVRVADTGTGIPDRVKRRVFDPFYQVEATSTREYSGSGLGLSIVKQLVDAHGGTVAVEDNPGGGSVFVVRLPVWTGQA